jgi:N-acetylmuramoyl-L-alanine amidase
MKRLPGLLVLSLVLSRAALAGPFLVCIDPGHPSETSEGAFENGLSENALNWQVAGRLARRLAALNIDYVLTKNSEHELVTNRHRAEIANGDNRYAMAAALFIRLHCDTGSGHGYTWYYPDRAGRKYGVTGPSEATQRASRELAETLNSAMAPVLSGCLTTNPIKTDASTFVGGKQGGVLTGSIFSRVPTALIEMCFINQRGDARFIASDGGQDKMAQALLAGILAWKSKLGE